MEFVQTVIAMQANNDKPFELITIILEIIYNNQSSL